METSARSRTKAFCAGNAFAVVTLGALLLLFTGCGRPTIANNDPGLSMSGGKVFYKGKPFTGILRAEVPASREISTTPYRRGIEHGTAVVKLQDGTIMSRRKYVLGVKHGLHRTWHRNGKPRSYARFKYGRYSGDFWAWHQNGRPSDFKRYDENGKILAAKRWRRTGRIYMNHVFRDGAQIGMPGSKVCNPTRPEKTAANQKDNGK